jgi:hypothetical protein
MQRGGGSVGPGFYYMPLPRSNGGAGAWLGRPPELASFPDIFFYV